MHSTATIIVRTTIVKDYSKGSCFFYQTSEDTSVLPVLGGEMSEEAGMVGELVDVEVELLVVEVVVGRPFCFPDSAPALSLFLFLAGMFGRIFSCGK